MIATGSPAIRLFSENDHVAACIEVALAVKSHDAAYPPPDVAATPVGFAEWLSAEVYLGRWVALVDGAVVGHVGICAPHRYLGRVLETTQSDAEVTKLFIHPAFRGHGVGSLLLSAALDGSQRLGLRPVLAVLDTTPDAVRLYRRHGGTQVGTFFGTQGLNLVFTFARPQHADPAPH